MLSRAAACILAVALARVVVDGQYDNNFDRKARIECPENEILSFIGSVRSNEQEGRTWSFRCKKSPRATKVCKWTDYLNGINQPVRYNCPGSKVLNGMRTVLVNGNTDRPYMVQCCTVNKKSTNNCYFTDFLNDWGGKMEFNVPGGRAVKGVYSVNNGTEDRRWQFYVCGLA